MARKFAKRFNNMYKVDYFVEPVPYNFGEELVKVPGLDGSGKMGAEKARESASKTIKEVREIIGFRHF